MPSNKTPKQGSESQARERFPTIDDAVQKAQELNQILETLTHQKYPLDVRRGIAKEEVSDVRDSRKDSLTIKARSKTYFIDVEEGKSGEPYLRITESRMKGKDGKPERSSIIVFRDDIKEFASAIAEMAEKLA